MILGSSLTAKPIINEKTKYYNVSGSTVSKLRKSMKATGPNGFWAYAEWWVSWNAQCKLRVKITYTMPKIKDRAKTPLSVLKKWDAMLAQLLKHEKQHGQHGINAAQEIEAANCKNGNAIIKKWAAEDKAYDKRTKHGIKEGVGRGFRD